MFPQLVPRTSVQEVPSARSEEGGVDQDFGVAGAVTVGVGQGLSVAVAEVSVAESSGPSQMNAATATASTLTPAATAAPTRLSLCCLTAFSLRLTSHF
jgi:hypothetical protein